MVRAYVMVTAKTGDADRLKREIGAVDGVDTAHIVAGDVDLIATVTVDSPAEVKNVAATHIQSVDGIDDTKTYIAMD